MDELRDAQRKLARQRYWLLERHPFFATPLLQLEHLADASVSSISSDGTRLFYNPSFVNSSTTDDLRYQLCQVVMACCLKHHIRRGEREDSKWQVASQLVIRPILHQAGLTLDDKPGIKTSIERAYGLVGDGDGTQNSGRIMDAPGDADGNETQDQDGNGNGDNNVDQDVLDDLANQSAANGVDESDESQSGNAASNGNANESAKWDRIVAQSKAFERLNEAGGPAGKDTGDLLSQIEAAKSQQVDWRDALRDLMTQPAKLDYSWSRPNRRYIDAGLYLPSVDGTARGNFVLAIDTSGSMSTQALRMVWSEVLGICEDTLPDTVTVMFADTEIKSIQEFEGGDLPSAIHMPGRGGTCFAPVFTEIDNWLEQPDALVFLTDLCANDFPHNEPAYPVLWAGIDFVRYPDGAHRDIRYMQGAPPWGQRVSLTVDYND